MSAVLAVYVGVRNGIGAFRAEQAAGDLFVIEDVAPPLVYSVGECLLIEPSGSEIGTVTQLGCEAPHTYEVYHVFVVDTEAGSYPGPRRLLNFSEDVCIDELPEYLDSDIDQTDLAASAWYPAVEEWQSGERSVVCLVFEEQFIERPGTGSLRSSS